jgi:hypothetical protein
VLSPAEQARLQRRTLGVTRERMLRELAEALEALTEAHLVVLVLEDLHWSDPSRVEVLTMLARRQEAARLVVLGMYRPVELILPVHPLKQAKAELQLHGHCTELVLGSLQGAAVAAYVAQRFLTSVAQTVAPMLYQQTAEHLLVYAAHGRVAGAAGRLAGGDTGQRAAGDRRVGYPDQAGTVLGTVIRHLGQSSLAAGGISRSQMRRKPRLYIHHPAGPECWRTRIRADAGRQGTHPTSADTRAADRFG